MSTVTEVLDDRVVVERDAELELSDRVVLRADVYRPVGLPHDAPVVLQRTPYDKSLYTELGRYFARAGYIYVMQDVRGQFASGGVWEPFVNEGADGVESIAWAARLPGSTGHVGLVGTSYQATCAWQAAARRPPELAAIVSGMTPIDYYTDWFFPGGAFSLAFATTWLLRNVANSAVRRLPDGAELSAGMTRDYKDIIERWYSHLPLNSFPPLHPDRGDVAEYFFSWLNDHPIRDQYWQDLSLRGRLREVDVPVLNVAGWYDPFAAAGVEAFQSRPAGPGNQLVIGPWGHNMWQRQLGNVDFGEEATFSFPRTVIAWMDRWLKDSPGSTPVAGPHALEPPVRYFSMGDLTWRESDQWPPAGVEPRAFHLAEDGRLTGESGPPAADEYTYDPTDPAPSVGGHSCCYEPASPMGPYDQRVLNGRRDILHYCTDPLTEDLEGRRRLG
jgi:putative CocE/NonD family hydrolase